MASCLIFLFSFLKENFNQRQTSVLHNGGIAKISTTVDFKVVVETFLVILGLDSTNLKNDFINN